jgi:hypothetical protein
VQLKSILSGCVTRSLTGTKELSFFSFALASGDSRFGIAMEDGWGGYAIEPPWAASAMACARYESAQAWVVVACSASGETWEMVPDTGKEKLAKIPGRNLRITKLAKIDDAIWACGMDRRVLRRDINGKWKDLSAPSASEKEGVIGFTALSAVRSGEMVAVGWQGEIWLRKQDIWKKQKTESRANFNAVSVGDDGQIVAVGDRGAIVIGTRGRWQTVDAKIDFDLQGVSHFGDELFVCSDDAIFKLEDGDLVKETRFAKRDRPRTCLNLLRGTLSLYCQGEADIFRYAANRWTRVST